MAAAKETSPKDIGEIAGQWVALAQKRRAHLLDLRETGRWQRYYSEASLAAQLREAESCIAEWGGLVPSAMVAHAAAEAPGDVAG